MTSRTRYCAAYVSGKGNLTPRPGATRRFEPIGDGEVVDKLQLRPRLVQEVRFGLQLARSGTPAPAATS